MAQSVAPQARVVYVNNDPVVLVYARTLLTSDPAGATSYIDGHDRLPGRS
jgi:S-adenosyl methyltransferase